MRCETSFVAVVLAQYNKNNSRKRELYGGREGEGASGSGGEPSLVYTPPHLHLTQKRQEPREWPVFCANNSK